MQASSDDPERTSGIEHRAARDGPDRALREQRLRALVEAHMSSIWRTLRRLGVPEADLDDALQEVYLVAARRLDDIPPASERAFLLGTAVRVAATRRRTLARRRESFDALPERPDLLPSPEELTSRKRARVVLEQILAQLDEEFRTCFVLFELEGLAAPQIAELLQIPIGTVASRLRRARELFRDAVKRYRARAAFGSESP